MDSFKDKEIPDIENPFNRNSLCDVARDASNYYIEWLDNHPADAVYGGHKGCHGMSCQKCIINNPTKFRTWKAHLKMTGND